MSWDEYLGGLQMALVFHMASQHLQQRLTEVLRLTHGDYVRCTHN